jgi:hypothetical protein
MTTTYKVTIGVIPNCTYFDFFVTKKRGSVKHPTHGLTSADPGVHVPFP